MNWPKIINEVLTHHDISQLELSKRTKISPGHICLLKSGKRKNPDYEKGLRIIELHPKKKELLNAKT